MILCVNPAHCADRLIVGKSVNFLLSQASSLTLQSPILSENLKILKVKKKSEGRNVIISSNEC